MNTEPKTILDFNFEDFAKWQSKNLDNLQTQFVNQTEDEDFDNFCITQFNDFIFNNNK